jgi:uncharacterized protein YlxW (UPF0749 family)
MIPKLILNKDSKSAKTPKENELRAKVEELVKKADDLKKEIEDLKNLI